MNIHQLSLEQAIKLASQFVPSGWRVRVQYHIQTDGVVVRVDNEDRTRYADLAPISARDLYLSADAFSNLLKASIEAAVEQINNTSICTDTPDGR